jgi:hypothetical protein
MSRRGLAGSFRLLALGDRHRAERWRFRLLWARSPLIESADSLRRSVLNQDSSRTAAGRHSETLRPRSSSAGCGAGDCGRDGPRDGEDLTTVDMPLRLDNANETPTGPQQKHKQPEAARFSKDKGRWDRSLNPTAVAPRMGSSSLRRRRVRRMRAGFRSNVCTYEHSPTKFRNLLTPR